MKKQIFFWSALSACFLAVTGYAIQNLYWKTSIPPLKFSLPGESGPVKNFKYEATNVSEFTGEINVYRLVSKNIDRTKFQEIAKKFFTNYTDDKHVSDPKHGYSYKEGDRYISVENGGRLIYSVENDIDLSRKGLIPLPSDKETAAIATDFLQQRGLLPHDFFLFSVSDGLVTVYPDLSRDVVNKQVIYHRKVNGKEVLGVSRIQVDVGEGGIVERVAILYHDIEPFTQKSLKAVNMALEDLKNGKGLEHFGKGLQPKKCLIDKIELSYFEQPVIADQPYLYPVYKATGKILDENGVEAEYVGIVEAIQSTDPLRMW